MSLFDISRDVSSATFGSFLCAYTGQPFDTVKVRLQSELLQPLTSSSKSPKIKQGTNPFAMTAKIVKQEGISALWKGVVPTGMGMVLENACAFAVNEQLKRFFKKGDNYNDDNKNPAPNQNSNPNTMMNLLQHKLVQPFFIGAISGFTSALVLIPSEVIKSRTQMETKQGVGSWDIFKKMIKTGGAKTMFTGLDAQFARDIPFYMVFFGSYDALVYSGKQLFPNTNQEVVYFMSGGFAGMFSWAVAMPFDVPKTMVQTKWGGRVWGGE